MLLSIIRHAVNLVLWLLPPTRMLNFRGTLLRLAAIDVGDGARVCGRGWIYGRGRLSIGKRSWISPGTEFFTHPTAIIQIGPDCDVGPGCSFVTGSHAIGPPERRAGEGCTASIIIGAGSWIGAKTLLLGGITVGQGSIIAAGSVVAESVPDNCLAAGVPARAKKDLGH